ncbi:MAG TPA: tryptophan--tRNA ligase [Gemmatimonadales bacterium]|jgi:tryptophanyl-tRNA synthetase|nr:tryptophan--tRNA ligase [Gemmatimonadales bacterium]
MDRIFSGIQPTGDLHIGNWLGAVRNWVALQHQFDSIICVVDLHAVTLPYEVSALAARTRDMAIGLLAAGIDPERAILFVQSAVPEHAELNWLFTTIAPLGELERMTQFKDKTEKLESIPVGLLCYPILQAADILLYRANKVPVGEDQVQHLELSREIARRWNAAYAQGAPFFPEPQPLLTPASRVKGLDGKAKMSKSLGNTIGLLESPEEIWEKLRPAATDPARVTRKDPGTPELCNIYALHQYFSSPETVVEVAEKCRTAGWGCLDCKRRLADAMIATLAPIRARAEELKRSPAEVDGQLARGAERARAIARETLREAKRLMGFHGVS